MFTHASWEALCSWVAGACSLAQASYPLFPSCIKYQLVLHKKAYWVGTAGKGEKA